MPRIKFPDQVHRIDGKDCFLEVLCGAASIDKVGIQFVSYDKSRPQGNRETDNITIYLDMFEAMVLAGDILSGKLAGLAQVKRKEAADAKKNYPDMVYQKLGGTPAKNSETHTAVSRQFQIFPGNQKPWVMTALSGPGKETETGLIAPDGRPTSTIRIPMDDQKIKEFAYALQMVVSVWANVKFSPVIAPRIQERRERDNEAIRVRVGKKSAVAAAPVADSDNDGFPVELPFHEEESA